MSLKTILFDLDGTLLPMDQDAFVASYFKRISKTMAPLGYEPQSLVRAIWQGTEAMIKNDGKASNEAVFWTNFSSCFGERVQADKPHFDTFYLTEFDPIRLDCGYNADIPPFIEWLKGKGISLVLATNPIFPAVATEHRIRWAGLKPSDFLHITTYENSRFSKPNPAYYEDILTMLGLTPSDCLMVGNDVGDDMPAEKLGMHVFLLTDCLINHNKADVSVYPHGGLSELRTYIEKQIS